MNKLENISTQYRLSIKTTGKLKDVISAIADIENVSTGDLIHQMFKDKFQVLLETDDIDLPESAISEVNKHFDLVLSLN